MNDKCVYRTAQATPGLLKKSIYKDIGVQKISHKISRNNPYIRVPDKLWDFIIHGDQRDPRGPICPFKLWLRSARQLIG